MRRENTLIITIIALILFVPSLIFSDYVLMCTFFDTDIARVYGMSDNGDIKFMYNVQVKGSPANIVFSPDGHWGLVGSFSSVKIPDYWFTSVLKCDIYKNISLLNTIENKYGELLAIRNDSKFGVYGCELRTIKMKKDYSYEVYLPQNLIGSHQSDFSSLNNHLYVRSSESVIYEYDIEATGRVNGPLSTLALSPGTGFEDMKMSPDGRTIICVCGGTPSYAFTSIRISENAPMQIACQKNSDKFGAYADQCVITPDSKYLIATFPTFHAAESYAIDGNSMLTLADSISLDDYPREDMAITPDGKYVVTRDLKGGSKMMVIKVSPEGKLTYLPDKCLTVPGDISAMAFLPPYKDYLTNSFLFY